MRRSVWIALAWSFILQMLTATPAHAWWEFVAALSGPDLHGVHFEGRVVCLMTERKTAQPVPPPPPPPPPPPSPPPPRQEISTIPVTPGIGVILPCLKRIPDRPEFRRLASVDLGIRWLWDNSFEPTEPRRVNFVSVVPVITVYPIQFDKADVIDVSVGVGPYWFVSNAFTGLRGYLHDVRADFHFPTHIRKKHKAWVLAPTWRFGRLTFPAGFEENAFADVANNKVSKRMEGPEKVLYGGVFWDFDALFLK